LKHID